MPPTRGVSNSGIAKPMKTERTHEENQERAYIAASRRSDRSLEARIESARRASEIHKKRTGRALKVTEQDVLNEEMYEEEDDDLPAQYRRLQAHLSGGFPFTNHRFESYMLSNLAMRTAMLNGYNHQGGPMSAPYANPPVFSNNFSPQQMSNTYSPNTGSTGHSPTTHYRAAPYPQSQQYKPMMHGRSASMAGPMANYGNVASPTTPGVSMTEEQRRMSLPVRAGQAVSPSTASHHSAPRPTLSRSGSTETNGSTPHTAPAFDSPHTSQSESMPNMQAQSNYTGFVPPTDIDMSAQGFGYRADPLTPSLPLNQQQILGALPGMENYLQSTPFSQQFSYPYNPSVSSKGQHSQQPANVMMSGMNQTLSGNPLGLTVPPQHMMMASPNMGTYTTSPTSALSLPSQEMQGSGWLTPFAAGPGIDGGFDFGDQTLFGHPSGTFAGGNSDGAGGEEYSFASFINDD